MFELYSFGKQQRSHSFINDFFILIFKIFGKIKEIINNFKLKKKKIYSYLYKN